MLKIQFLGGSPDENSVELQSIATEISNASDTDISLIKKSNPNVKADVITALAIANSVIGIANLIVNILRFQQGKSEYKYAIHYKSKNRNIVLRDLDYENHKKFVEILEKNDPQIEITIERYEGRSK